MTTANRATPSSSFSMVMTCITDDALDNFRHFLTYIEMEYDSEKFYQNYWQQDLTVKPETSKPTLMLAKAMDNKVGESEKTGTAPPINPNVCHKCGHTQPAEWENSTCIYNMWNVHNICSKYDTKEHDQENCQECQSIQRYKELNARMLESQKQEYLFDKSGNLVKSGIDPHRRYDGKIIRHTVIPEIGPETNLVEVFSLDYDKDVEAEKIYRVSTKSQGTASGQTIGTETVEGKLGMRHEREDDIFVNTYASVDPIESFHQYIESGGVEGNVPVLNNNYEDNQKGISRLNPLVMEYDLDIEDPIGARYTVDAEKHWKIKTRSSLNKNMKRRRGIEQTYFETEKAPKTPICDCEEYEKSFKIPLSINVEGTQYDMGSQYDFNVLFGQPQQLKYEGAIFEKGGKQISYNGISDKCANCNKLITHEEQTRNINDYLAAGNQLPYGIGKLEAMSLCTSIPPITKTFIGKDAVKMIYRQRKIQGRVEDLRETSLNGEAQTETSKTSISFENQWDVVPLLKLKIPIEQITKLTKTERHTLNVKYNMAKILRARGGSLNVKKANETENDIVNQCKLKTVAQIPISTPTTDMPISIGLEIPQKTDYGSGAEPARQLSKVSGNGIVTRKQAIKTWYEYWKANEWNDNENLKLDSKYWQNWAAVTQALTGETITPQPPAERDNKQRPVVIGIVGMSTKLPSEMKTPFKNAIEEQLKGLHKELGKRMIVISGGARGVDQFAIEIAKTLNIPYLEFKPANQQWDDGYKARNNLIALHAHRMINFVLKHGVYLKCPAPIIQPDGKKVFKQKKEWTPVEFDEDCVHCVNNKDYKHDSKVNHQKSGGCYTAWAAKEAGCGSVRIITCDTTNTEVEEIA